MSVERVNRKGGVAWRVRWRDSSGRARSRVLGRRREAEAFDAELKRRKRTGELDLVDAGKQTLAAFVEDWWRLYAEPNLARATLESYSIHWDAYVLPHLGNLRLREVTPEQIEDMRAELVAAGVGPASIRKALVLLQSVLQRAVEWRRIPHNPAKLVRKPPARRARAVRPLAPDTLERMRAWLLQRGRRRDAVLVSLLAYAGLRPGEALALSWEHVRERTLLVERALSHGEMKSTKRGRRGRCVCWRRSPQIWSSGDSPRAGPTRKHSSFRRVVEARGATTTPGIGEPAFSARCSTRSSSAERAPTTFATASARC
jgi:integrase